MLHATRRLYKKNHLLGFSGGTMQTRKVASSTRETVRSNCRPFRIGISSRNISESPSTLPSGRAGHQGDLSEMARMLWSRAAHCSSRGQPRISGACRCSCASLQSRPGRTPAKHAGHGSSTAWYPTSALLSGTISSAGSPQYDPSGYLRCAIDTDPAAH
jgi:hypothetical protein